MQPGDWICPDSKFIILLTIRFSNSLRTAHIYIANARVLMRGVSFLHVRCFDVQMLCDGSHYFQPFVS